MKFNQKCQVYYNRNILNRLIISKLVKLSSLKNITEKKIVFECVTT